MIENQICLFCYITPTSSQLYHTCFFLFLIFFCISSNLCKYMKVNTKKLNNNVPRTWLLSLHTSMNFLSALSNFQAFFSVTYFKMKALITTIIIVYRSVTLLKLSQNWRDWWHLSTLLSMWYLRTIICGFFWLKRCLWCQRPQCVYKLSLIFSSLFGCFSVLWLVSILASVIIPSHGALYGDKSSFFSVCPCFSN